MHFCNLLKNATSSMLKLPAAKNIFSEASVYLHYPYCAAICSYCNFNKYKVPKEGLGHSRFESAIITDLKAQLSGCIKDKLVNTTKKTVKSVYFGGGTPSLARPELISKVLRTIRDNCHVSDDLEVTLECNPTELELLKLEAFRKSGINRISLGVQVC